MDQSLQTNANETAEKALRGLDVQTAQAYRVTDLESKQVAASRRDIAVEAIKVINAWFDPHVKNAYKAWKDLTSARTTALKKPQAIVDNYKRSIQVYDAEQRDRQREREAELQKEATKQEEDRRLQQAEELIRNGRADEANALIDQPIDVPIIPEHADPDEKVQSYRDNWVMEVYDLQALVKHIADNPHNINLIEPNQTALNQMARALKAAVNIPGVKAVNKQIPVMPRS